MRNLWLVILVGLAAGFFTEKILVASQLATGADDLYLERQTSGEPPFDDEDGEDDGSGSGSGDYVNNMEDAELLKFLTFTKSTTAAGRHEPATTAAPNALPGGDKDEKVIGFGQTTSPPRYTTAIDSTDDDKGDETVVRSNFDHTESSVKNEILAKEGRGSRIYEIDASKEVTSESLWERTEVFVAVIACAVVGFICTVFLLLLLLLLIYRLKKKDEGSYDLGETKLSNTAYHKAPTKEFYA